MQVVRIQYTPLAAAFGCWIMNGCDAGQQANSRSNNSNFLCSLRPRCDHTNYTIISFFHHFQPSLVDFLNRSTVSTILCFRSVFIKKINLGKWKFRKILIYKPVLLTFHFCQPQQQPQMSKPNCQNPQPSLKLPTTHWRPSRNNQTLENTKNTQ